MKYEENVRIQSCSFQNDLQVLCHTVYEKTYFNHVIYKNVTEMYTENRARSASVIMRMCSFRPIEP